MKREPLIDFLKTDQTDGVGTICGCVLMAAGCGLLWLVKGFMEFLFL